MKLRPLFLASDKDKLFQERELGQAPSKARRQKGGPVPGSWAHLFLAMWPWQD